MISLAAEKLESMVILPNILGKNKKTNTSDTSPPFHAVSRPKLRSGPGAKRRTRCGRLAPWVRWLSSTPPTDAGLQGSGISSSSGTRARAHERVFDVKAAQLRETGKNKSSDVSLWRRFHGTRQVVRRGPAEVTER